MSWRHEDVAEFITRLCLPALACPSLKIKRLSNKKLPFLFSTSRVCNPLTSGLCNSYDPQNSTSEAWEQSFRPLPSCFPFFFTTRTVNQLKPSIAWFKYILSRFSLSFFSFPFVSYSQPKLFPSLGALRSICGGFNETITDHHRLSLQRNDLRLSCNKISNTSDQVRFLSVMDQNLLLLDETVYQVVFNMDTAFMWMWDNF